MRLTLRTLLAYLDNTLDPQDEEALRIKLAESSFATQLVQRIRSTLNNQMLAAPSPDAVGPVDDANAISEYLDSTLSHQQVAEIERACLESDPHLAEAAACHQILTMVLGTPANVPAALRQRIYELPDRQIEQIAAGERFASLALPIERAVGQWSDDVPTSDETLVPDKPIEPVGVADSGVSDAPTRLREMEIDNAADAPATKASKSQAAIAGSKLRSMRDSELYGGMIRPSRITPWLVTLAVAGVLLFALSRIFAPLLGPDRQIADATPLAETNVPGESSAAMIDVSPTDQEPPSVSDETVQSLAKKLPAPTAEPAETADTDAIVAPPVSELTLADSEPEGDLPERTADADIQPGDIETEPPMTEPRVVAAPEEKLPESADLLPSEKELVESDSVAPLNPGDAAMTKEPVSGAKEQVGKITSANTLIAAISGTEWSALDKGAPLETMSTIVCAPTFRAEMVTDDQLTTTMVGPARVRWQVGEEKNKTLHVESGRVLLSPSEADTAVDLVLAGHAVRISFSEPTHVVAISVNHLREPGLDPLRTENLTPVRTITAIQGSVAVTGDGDQTLETGQQWMMYGNAEPTITNIDPVPAWVQPPDPNDLSLEANARQGLLGLLAAGEQPLEMALREATSFRQSEVAALAGQTLLALGRADVYFDGAGILNQPKQRAYWPDHFLAIQNTINQGGSYATSLKDSISRMDSANVAAIMRLLTGYSQQQLQDGGDEELVEMLDSPSMAVRVLALENLRQIKGTTLYFRAEEDSAARRNQVIKKWVARQKKGDIRWPE